MAAKTTSGSGFLFRFAFSTFDLIDLAQNLKISKGHFFDKFGVKTSKFQKLFKRVTKTFHNAILHFTLLFCASRAPLSPNLVRIRKNFQGQTAGGVFSDLVFFSRRFSGQITRCHV